MKKQRTISALLICLLLCGLTVAHAAEVQSGSTRYPADVQISSEGGTHQIVKTYILAVEQSPEDIPRESFYRGDVYYTFADLTMRSVRQTDTYAHTKAVEVPTDTSDIAKIITLLPSTMEYDSADGYCGLLTLDEQSVTSKAMGYTNSSYAVSATREYPYLSSNDISLVPKTITENGRTMELADVNWEAQQTSTVDCAELPDSYRAIATYTTTATRSIVTGYVGTAEYSGSVTKVISDNILCSAIFTGTEIAPEPPANNEVANHAVLIAGIALIAAQVVGLTIYHIVCRRSRKRKNTF